MVHMNAAKGSFRANDVHALMTFAPKCIIKITEPF